MRKSSGMTPLEIRTLNRTKYHPQNLKMCTRCEKIKPRTDAHFVVNCDNSNKKRDRHKGFCKACDKQRRKKQRKDLKSNPEHYFERLITTLKHRAKKQSIPFNIKGSDLYQQYLDQNKLCYWTGKSFDWTDIGKDSKTPGNNFITVDKLEPSKGYIKGNCVLSLWSVNKQKNNLTHAEFINFCHLIAQRFPK